MFPPGPSPPFLRLRTPQFTHHNLAFSPFFDTHFALASGKNFGLVGNGRVHIAVLDPNVQGGVRVVRGFDTQDCVYDVAWNESHENQIVAACGNGAIKMFDITLEGLPIKAWHEHSAEIMSIEWNNLQKDTFVTASWDGSIKVWTTTRTTSLLTIPPSPSRQPAGAGPPAQLYNATFSPHSPSLICSCSSDGLLNIYDIRSSPPSGSGVGAVQTIPAGVGSGPHQAPSEILSCDWNKYVAGTIATASKDGSIKIWDMRSTKGAGAGLEVGRHGLAARKVAWSPHKADLLASTSYDMTCRTWSTTNPGMGSCHSDHSEFVMGVGWALFDEGLLASAAWDEEVHLYRV
ncbi:hypothetical protein CI109_107187 [Kwoniella shandongensis]|uniref:Peroxin-7 n=1 Tax=Kwoniella shandongensis TaxID=1734106 RepID=A0A5M6C7E5_9TREE|nr:uncharacterized protein CI109_002470 [Kwoniella shandongensis]KAA5529129.1 hypothetical protein CI109_002470 [Kwoniella shandongensis]